MDRSLKRETGQEGFLFLSAIGKGGMPGRMPGHNGYVRDSRCSTDTQSDL